MDFAELNRSGQELHKKLFSRVRILVVDDEDIVCQLLKEMLAADGFHVDTAASAEEAWHRIEVSEYDLLVTDKNLPNLTGVDLIRKVREAGFDLPSVIITGYASVETVSEALEHGASDYIVKPFDDIFHVTQRLRRVIDRRLSGLLYALIVNKLKSAIAAGKLDPVSRDELGRALFSFKKNLDKRLDVLMVDSPSPLLAAIRQTLGEVGISSEEVERLRDLLTRFDEANPPLVVLVRLDFPELQPLIQELKRTDPQLEILAFARDTAPLSTALNAVRGGASDFILFGAEGFPVLQSRVDQAVDRSHRRRLNLHLVATLYRVAREVTEDDWDGLLAVLPDVDREYIHRIAQTHEEEVTPVGNWDLGGFLDAAVPDRRLHQRHAWQTDVWFVYHDTHDPAQAHSVRGRTRNISRGGMLIHAGAPPVGTCVMVHLPEGGPLIGRVVRHYTHETEFGFGVEFLNTEADVERIVGFLAPRQA